ncbi:hypothetical protein [Spirosoma sp. KUDC1026]|uniref:hypothetical protein n=1 Tax=Spirosoma sp. KUDC1026 TaxID=2745947 RepID=UPI00159BBC09|nr:hypothetical protein [Spirosoma sp. KUDC1026]QKZ13774.1 hypothetical protein HU175_14505 [Spirosoma sp. KUDC1026]
MNRMVVDPELIIRCWDIDGYPNYFFGADKHLYQIDSRGRYNRRRLVMKRYTRGYTLKSRFLSLSQLRPLLRRHDPTIDHPVGF